VATLAAMHRPQGALAAADGTVPFDYVWHCAVRLLMALCCFPTPGTSAGIVLRDC
jgi:hypothetical protein